MQTWLSRSDADKVDHHTSAGHFLLITISTCLSSHTLWLSITGHWTGSHKAHAQHVTRTMPNIHRKDTGAANSKPHSVQV